MSRSRPRKYEPACASGAGWIRAAAHSGVPSQVSYRDKLSEEVHMTKKHLTALKEKLQKGDPKALERLAADLVSKLVGVRLTVAKSGFQHGSDAGTVGRAGRHLRLECKRYADNSPLDDRNLQGEIDDALRQDGALEAWILFSTRGVPQQTEESLHAKAITTGVPVIVIDWRQDSAELPTLAALCAWAPEVVEKHYGKAARTAAKAMAAPARPVVERLIRELSPWVIGYQSLLDGARTRFRKLWSDAAESRSVFGQNVAGGTVPVILRQSVSSGLESWWQSNPSSAAVVHGDEGMGKTWAAVQWAQSRLNTLPIFLMLPSSAFKEMRGITHASVAEFIGDALHDLTPGTDRTYWRARVERLLQRPVNEGPVLLLLVDGVNQEPSFEWERFLQLLEGGVFGGRVRLIVTVQTHFLRERLHDLRRLSYPATKLEVGPYDLSKGGEFDTLLSRHGVDRKRLSSAVIELARVPRLFELAIHQSSDAALQGEPTPGRLLWAHARDELGLKAKVSLSENDWDAWLQDLATRYLKDILAGKSLGKDEKGYSTKELGEMVRDPAGSADETARRLHEIVSGTWLEPIPGRSGRLRPTEATIHLALGIAVLGSLDVAEQTSAEEAARVLDEYLDAVRATSAAANILASALSVLVEKRWPLDSIVPRLVLSALLQSQNASDEQRQHAVQLAPTLVGPLLHVVEDSRSRAYASARHWALVALHEIPAVNTSAWEAIANRMVDWVAHANCPAPGKMATDDEAAKHQAKLLTEMIGTATPGVHRVLGVPVRLHELERDDLGDYVPQLLLGKPLISARKVLVAAAVAAAVAYAGKVWSGLKWLVMLNPVDRAELQAELVRLSVAAKGLERESGVHADVGQWVSGLLLWLTGDEHLEREANSQRVVRPEQFSYSTHYLADPARSLFALERRHIDLLWLDARTPAFGKLQRAKAFLPDPSLTFPASLTQEVIEWGKSLNLEALSSGRNYSAEDHNLDSFLPSAARVSPQAVGEVVTRWFRTFGGREEERRHWAALTVPRFSLLIGPGEVDAIHDLRLRRPKSPDRDERVVLLSLLEGELLKAPVDVQLDMLVTEQNSFISIALVDVMRAPETETVKEFVHRWGLENARAVEVLCNYLWTYPATLDDDLFDRLLQHALSKGEGHQTLAFMALTVCNPEQFGQALLNAGWKPLPSANEYLQDFGSKAVLAVSSGRTLAEVSDLVAPWCLLDEAVKRGGNLEDLEVAAQAIDRALLWDGLSTFPTVARISVESVGTRNFISVKPSLQASDEDDGFKSLDPDARWARHQAARETGETYLRNAKAAGAVMATRVVSLEAARMLVARCPEVVSRWLEGLGEPTQALVSRLNLAGGLFLALCEALLETDATRGAQLWHLLRRHLRIRFVGVGELDELLLMPFRVPESAAVLELKEQLYSFPHNANDESYLDLMLAAVSQGGLSWLESAIAADDSATEPFRRKRAITLQGFLPTEQSFQPKWQEGECVGTWDALRMRAQETRNRASQARYWWRGFLTAPDALSAFCSWQIFLACADKMAWVWMDSDIDSYREDNELWRLKMLHKRFNASALKSAINEKSGKGSNSLNTHLVGWDSPDGWFALDALTGLGY